MSKVDTFGPPRMTVVDHGTVDGIRWATCRAPIYGAVNGYAQIPEDHPWFGLKDSWEEDTVFDGLDMPGGMTYGPAADGWIGFDTLHLGDYWPGAPEHWTKTARVVWTPAMVAEEAAALAAQIARARDSGPPVIDAEVASVREDDPALSRVVADIAALLGDASQGTVEPSRALEIAQRAVDEACDNREGK